MNHRISYAAEEFAAARYMLMLPHPEGEARSVAGAFFECEAGLEFLERKQLDLTAGARVRELDTLMETDGLSDPISAGLLYVKAKSMKVNDRAAVSHLVNELADWFDRMSDTA